MKNKLINILFVSAIVLAIAVFVVAQTQEEELNGWIQELSDEGYGWLVEGGGKCI